MEEVMYYRSVLITYILVTKNYNWVLAAKSLSKWEQFTHYQRSRFKTLWFHLPALDNEEISVIPHMYLKHEIYSSLTETGNLHHFTAKYAEIRGDESGQRERDHPLY